MIVAISLGNSRITAGRLDGGEVRERQSASAREPDEWPDLLDWISGHGPSTRLVAVSVNPAAAEAFGERLAHGWLLMGRDLEIPVRNLTARPEQTGHDRLLSGYAAQKLYGRPVLVVDFGTAFTFNLMDEEGSFLGGAIAPGLEISKAGLFKRCAQLPWIEGPEDEVPLVGKDTESAIRSGIFNGYLGLVESLVNRMRDSTGNQCTVVATGGDAPYFVQRTSLFEIHDPDLLLKGIALAFEA
jgi:type III pantothenate kinase